MEKVRGLARTPESASSSVETGSNGSQTRKKLRGRARTSFEGGFGKRRLRGKVTKMDKSTPRRAFRMGLVRDQSMAEGVI